ncbi:MAG: hypothetical protein ACOC70_02680 [bacterium]
MIAVDVYGKVARFAWRLRAADLARRLAACLLGALAVAIAVAAVDKLIYLGIDTVPLVLCLALGGCVAAAVWSLAALRTSRLPATLRAAMAADRALGLADRLMSAVQLGRDDGPWVQAIVRDATERIRPVRPGDVFPLRASLPMRLFLPAAIVLTVLLLLPPADLLGRMEHEVADEVAAELEAERTGRAIAAARAAGPAGAPTGRPAEPEAELQRLRLRFFRIEREMLEGDMRAARQLELRDELRRLARRMAEHDADPELTAAIRRTARSLQEGNDEETVSALRATQEELDRMAKALAGREERTGHEAELADRLRAAMAESRAPEPAGPPPEPAEHADHLVELAPVADPPEPRRPEGGIVYRDITTGADPATATRTHQAARGAALHEISEGRIPPGYARLVRDYFDAVRPAGE